MTHPTETRFIPPSAVQQAADDLTEEAIQHALDVAPLSLAYVLACGMVEMHNRPDTPDISLVMPVLVEALERALESSGSM